jgi:hypothetical protein
MLCGLEIEGLGVDQTRFAQDRGARLIARGATLTASRPLGHWFIHLFKQLSHFHGMERHERLQVGVAIEPAQHRLVIAR